MSTYLTPPTLSQEQNQLVSIYREEVDLNSPVVGVLSAEYICVCVCVCVFVCVLIPGLALVTIRQSVERPSPLFNAFNI